MSTPMIDVGKLLADNAALEAENDRLRCLLANGSDPCVYCGLPKDRWSECPSGFPGCARGDDAMLCPDLIPSPPESNK